METEDYVKAFETLTTTIADMRKRIIALEATSGALEAKSDYWPMTTSDLEDKIREIATEVAEAIVEDIDWQSKVYDEVSGMSWSITLD